MATQQQLSFFNLSLLDADALISPQINLYNAPICLTWGFLSSENQLQQGHICSIWALPLNLPQTGKNLATFKLISIPHPDPPRAERCLNDAAVSFHCLDAQHTLWAHKREAAWFSGAPLIANAAPQWAGWMGRTSPSAGLSDWEAGN